MMWPELSKMNKNLDQLIAAKNPKLPIGLQHLTIRVEDSLETLLMTKKGGQQEEPTLVVQTKNKEANSA